MSDGAITEATLRASLQDIELPAHAAGGALAELGVVFGLAGFSAVILMTLFRLFSRRVLVAASEGPLDLRFDGLPDSERRVALLHVLKTHAPERYATLRDDLYKTETVLDLAALEHEVATHV